VIDAVGPFALELKRTQNLYGALLESIVYQQLSGKAAQTIYRRVCELFPRARGGPTPEQILGAPDQALRGAGLSRAKALAVRDLAEKAHAGAIPSLAKARRMDDAAIVDCVTEVRGIGRWTAEMLLIFRLGRPDVLPVDDYGVRKGFALVHRKRRLPTPKELAAHGERWRPYRTVATWYLWRALDLGKR
jgi:3-methyladenine DNA glycosylase/8-oxoguanine DNA glycosylase